MTAEKFDMADDKEIPCNCTGFSLSRENFECIKLAQEEYTRGLRPIPEDGDYRCFASARMKLAWLAHSRPDVLYEVSQLAQVTREYFEEERRTVIRRVNKVIAFVKSKPLAISFPKLDKDTLQVVGISDASFSSNLDSTSQLGYLVFLADARGSASPIFFKSYKARRVTRSVIGAELIAFSDMFDAAFSLAEELRTIHPKLGVPVKLYTDSKSLFDVISKGSKTAEKRLMLDIACAREGFRRHDISDIGFIRGEDNLADGLTKSMRQAAIHKVLKEGRLSVVPEQWIVRDPAQQR